MSKNLKILFLYILILELFQLFECLSKNKKIRLGELQINNGNSNLNNNSSGNDLCPIKKNCLNYEVFDILAGHQCASCNKDYMLTIDDSFKKSCDAPNKMTNCLKALKNPDSNGGGLYCTRCQKDFALQYLYNCLPIPTEKKIENCLDYEFFKNQNKCLNCEQGYTLDVANNKCSKGCSISNCGSCRMENNKEICYECLPDMIGVLGGNSLTYSKCLTCEEYKSQVKSWNLSILSLGLN
jgi:hypothetical protein